MKKVILSLIVLTVIILSSCQESKITNVEESCYVIIRVDPPKRVYVDVKRISDGRIFTGISLGKRLSNWRNIVIGDTIQLKRYTRSSGAQEYTDFNDSEVKQMLTIKYNL